MFIIDYFIKKKIPKAVFEEGDKILHISDTPDIALAYIKHLIRIIEPKYIVHTGDLVDNIKLEISRTKLDLYQRGVKKLVKSTKNIQTYYCIGNHDDELILKDYIAADYLTKHALISIDGIDIAISHYYHSINNQKADFLLFGHDMSIESDFTSDPVKLNGLEAIYVINTKNKAVYGIPYPSGTDGFRQLKFKVGL